MAIHERGAGPMPTAHEREAGDSDFAFAVDRGIEEGLERVERLARDEGLFFHNARHTKGVLRRTALLLSTIRAYAPELVSDRDVLIGKLAAGRHDEVQEYERKDVGDGAFTKTIRQRFVPDNEEKSAEAACVFMRKANQEAGRILFTEDDMHKVAGAIVDGTVAAFDPDTKTVIQPGLTRESPVLTRALALADLGEAGMSPPEEFLKSGDALFREENLDILEKLSRIHTIPKEEQEWIRDRILKWTNFQIVFAEGRKARLEKDLDGLPEQAQEAVRRLFRFFDVNIEATHNQAFRRERLTLAELVSDLGYSL